MERNNLFNFATSELSQDAIICWCLNWFNDNSNPRLKEMAISLVKRMAGDIAVSSVDIARQFSEKVQMENGTIIHVKVDVLAIINKDIGLIIEDKTTSDVHDNQIFRYVDGIKQILAKKGLLRADGNEYALDPQKLKTVYWKTGFFYDYDQAVSADVKIDAHDTMELLSPYLEDSEIIHDYIDYLDQNINWYHEHGDFTEPYKPENGIPCYDWNCNLALQQYPQYCLMRLLFPAERWNTIPDKKHEPYQVYHGSSFGRPYTQMVILDTVYAGTNDEYWLFWRIDTDNNGPYLSLRFYEGNLHKDNKERHERQYRKLKTILDNIMRTESLPIPLKKEDADPGFRGRYKESALFQLSLGRYLDKWAEQGEFFIQTIQVINDKFLEALG